MWLVLTSRPRCPARGGLTNRVYRHLWCESSTVSTRTVAAAAARIRIRAQALVALTTACTIDFHSLIMDISDWYAVKKSWHARRK